VSNSNRDWKVINANYKRAICLLKIGNTVRKLIGCIHDLDIKQSQVLGGLTPLSKEELPPLTLGRLKYKIALAILKETL
jgi:hypothetical protein